MFIVGTASAWRFPFGPLLLEVLRRLAFLVVVLLPVGMACAQEPGGSKSGEDPSPATLAVDLFETVTRLPVTVQPLFGGAHSGDMVLTHFKPPGDGPFPAVVMQHGRDSKQRANPARYRYTDVARYWVRRGVAVFVPTRLGYGDSGMDVDPEFTGICDQKNYDVAAAVMNVQTLATIDFATRQPWVDARKLIVMGQSMGGFASVAAMGARHPAVIAGINFAGGSGGEPVARKANPCSAFRLGHTLATAGKANAGSTPMLWLYAQNDAYWGPDIPRQWLDAYTRSGGKAEFAAFGPVGTDGHTLLAKGMPMWRPVLDRFVAPLGISAPRSTGAPPASGFAAIEDATRLPLVRQDVKDTGYPRFLALDLPRAIAIGPKGEWAYFSGDNAMQRSLDRCAQTARTACHLYAVDDQVVWRP